MSGVVFRNYADEPQAERAWDFSAEAQRRGQRQPTREEREGLGGNPRGPRLGNNSSRGGHPHRAGGREVAGLGRRRQGEQGL